MHCTVSVYVCILQAAESPRLSDSKAAVFGLTEAFKVSAWSAIYAHILFDVSTKYTYSLA